MPLDRGTIDQQLQALGESTAWWEQREMRDLPAVLHHDERILAIARGKVARLRWLRRSWLIVLTDVRLVCIRSSRRSWRQFEVDVDQVTRVSLRVGPFRGRLLIRLTNDTLRILLQRASAYRLQSALRSVVTAAEPVSGFGPTRVLRRVMDHMLALPAAAFNPQEQRAALPAPAPMPQDHTAVEYVQRLESEVDQLRQQVDFLEQLLRERQQNAALEAETVDRQPS